MFPFLFRNYRASRIIDVTSKTKMLFSVHVVYAISSRGSNHFFFSCRKYSKKKKINESIISRFSCENWTWNDLDNRVIIENFIRRCELCYPFNRINAALLIKSLIWNFWNKRFIGISWWTRSMKVIKFECYIFIIIYLS